nr:hypothetical protein DVH24_016637 [Ipomoea batatas]
MEGDDDVDPKDEVVLVRGDGDQGIQVLAGELILEQESAAVEKRLGEAKREVGEGGVAIHDHDAGVAADVAERLVVGAGDYVAAVAAHQPQLPPSAGGERRRLIPGLAAVAVGVVEIAPPEDGGGSICGGRKL